MKTKLIVLLFLLPLFQAKAQEISGAILDNHKDPLMTAKIRLTLGQLVIAETTTDFDGWYSFKPLDTGTYNVTVSNKGLKTFTYTDVPVSPANRTTLKFNMQIDTSKTNNEQISVKYRKSIIAPNENVVLEQMAIPHCRMQIPYSDEGRKSGSIYILDGSTAIEEVRATVEGGIDFTLTDSKNTITNAAIRCFKNDSMVRCATTSNDGECKLQFTDTGHYTVTVLYSGKKQMKIPVLIEQGSNSTYVICTLKNAVSEIINYCPIASYKRPKIDPYVTNYVVNAAEIKPRPTTNNSELLTFAPGIFQVRTNAPISSDGGRTTGNLYVADGIVLLPAL